MSKEDRIKEKLAKAPMHLLPGSSLRSVARVLGHGGKKHGEYSWKTYHPKAYFAALGRHWSYVIDGEFIDEEFGETHFAHMACSCLFLDWLYHNNKEAFKESMKSVETSNPNSFSRYKRVINMLAFGIGLILGAFLL